MGLNWSEGLKRAGEGLGGLANYYSHQEDVKAQEQRDAAQRAHAENLVRISQEYQTKQQDDQQEFLIGHQAADIEARRGEAEATRAQTLELHKLSEGAATARHSASMGMQAASLSAQEARDILAQTRFEAGEKRATEAQRNASIKMVMDQANTEHKDREDAFKAQEKIYTELATSAVQSKKDQAAAMKAEIDAGRAANDATRSFKIKAANLPDEKGILLQQWLALDKDPMEAMKLTMAGKSPEEEEMVTPEMAGTAKPAAPATTPPNPLTAQDVKTTGTLTKKEHVPGLTTEQQTLLDEMLNAGVPRAKAIQAVLQRKAGQ